MARGVARGGGRGGGRGRGRGHGRDNDSGGDTQSHNSGESHPSSVRGSNVLEQVPSDPKKRKFITVESEDEFSDHPTVIRDMTSILKTLFKGTWDTWKKVGEGDRAAMWRLFKGLYVWDESDGVVHKVWETCMQKRFSDTMKKVRDEALARAKAANVNVSMQGDLTLLKPYYPNWISKEDWASLIDEVWNTPKWKNLSQSGSQNRNKLEDGSVSKHCAGSISIRQHKKKMEVELERCPTGVEVYSKLHTKKSTQQYVTPKVERVKEAYENAMVAKYGDDTNCHPLFENETWLQVTGGIKKGRVFGFGSISDPESFLTGTSSTATSREAVYERVREEMEAKHQEMRAEMDAKAAELDAKAAELDAKAAAMDAKAAAMDAKAAAMDALAAAVDTKYEAMEKMMSELRNMRK